MAIEEPSKRMYRKKEGERVKTDQILNYIQGSSGERDPVMDLIPDLSPENHIKRVVKEANHISVSMKITFKRI